MALRCAADFCDEPRYRRAADVLAEAINLHLWQGDGYLLTHFAGADNVQVTGDMVFPALWGIAPADRARLVLDRLSRPDFWARAVCAPSGVRPAYDRAGFGLIGGSWPISPCGMRGGCASRPRSRAGRAGDGRPTRPGRRPGRRTERRGVRRMVRWRDGRQRRDAPIAVGCAHLHLGGDGRAAGVDLARRPTAFRASLAGGVGSRRPPSPPCGGPLATSPCARRGRVAPTPRNKEGGEAPPLPPTDAGRPDAHRHEPR
jgi:hypothetical protein